MPHTVDNKGEQIDVTIGCCCRLLIIGKILSIGGACGDVGLSKLKVASGQSH